MKTETQSQVAGTAYCMFDNIEINDTTKPEEYKEKFFPVVAAFGGKYLAASNSIRIVEGSWQPTYLVMIEFPGYEEANRWYDSDEYRELKNLRKSSGKVDGLMFEVLSFSERKITITF